MLKLTKIASLAGFALAALVMVSGPAQAQSASDYSCSATSGYGASYATYSTCTGTGNQASTTQTATAVLKVAAAQSAKLVSDRIASATSGAANLSMASNGFYASTGVAAGNHGYGAAAWVAGSWSDVEDDNTATAFDGNVYTAMVGVDFEPVDRVMLGLSVGYENTDIDTQYNGFGGVDGELDGDGWTIAPYVSYALADHARASLVAGYSDVEYDTLRFDPSTGNRITGSTDADRWFVDASLAGDFNVYDNWLLHTKGGIFYVQEDKDGFTETESNGATITQASNETELGQVLIDARLGYDFDVVEPYALVGLEFDFTKDEATVGAGQNKASFDDEDFGAKLGGGLKLKLSDQVTGGIEAYTVEFRDDYQEITATGNLRVKF